MEHIRNTVGKILHEIRTSALEVNVSRVVQAALDEESLLDGEIVRAIGATDVEVAPLVGGDLGVVYQTPNGPVAMVVSVLSAVVVDGQLDSPEPVVADKGWMSDELPWGNVHAMEDHGPSGDNRKLGPGERVIDGRVYYSAAWLGEV